MKRFIALLLCLCLCVGLAPAALAARSVEFEQTLAQDLKTLGLFQGVSETDFALNRAPTRVEALVMLIRVLGAEAAVSTRDWYHPFTDVPSWAQSYVGYAYENGLTKGISATAFGTGNATAQMYLTFVLRALGYSDSTGDFTWADPYTLAQSLNLLPACVDRGNFWRADVATVSYAALPVYLKDSGLTLADKLISAGVFTRETYNSVYRPNAIAQYAASRVMTAEQIFDACAPAVFYIEVYDKSGKAFASGSGFFLRADGIAVTNYHVIEGAASAKIRTNNGSVYDVAGVRTCHKAEDWAILQISGSNFPVLTPAANAAKTGQKIFTIGSPLGLQNTISEGLVSTASREVDGMDFIQISAAISSGSSGGALLDDSGCVLGITSAGFTDGQNLNLAIPISKVLNRDLSGINTLQEMFGAPAAVTPSAPQTPAGGNAAAASAALKTWIARNANITFLDKYPAVQLRETTSSGASYTFVIFHDPEENTICMNMDYIFSSGGSASSWLDLFPGGQTSFTAYYYYNRTTDRDWSVSAAAQINNPTFTGEAPLSFSSYEGSAANKTEHAKIAALLVQLSLVRLEQIFVTYSSQLGGHRISSFGFPPFS